MSWKLISVTGLKIRPHRPIDFPAISDAQRARWQLVTVFSPFEGDRCVGKIDDRTGFGPIQDIPEQRRTGPIVRIYYVPGS